MIRPTGPQIRAADPGLSAWVGANAGSGKTRVLTQRVARLLLDGAAPERILCLTYTKAAAAEMQSRLFDTLGDWAMADAGWLGETLAAISDAPEPVTDPERLARARRLFARALETPGGLKIQTIHAFCDAVLRRFPLEAGVSPRFRVLDDQGRARMLTDLRQQMALDAETGRDPAFDRVAARIGEAQIDQLIGAVMARRLDFAGGARQALGREFSAEALAGPEAAATAAFARMPAGLPLLIGQILGTGGKAEKTVAEMLADWLEHQAPSVPALEKLLRGGILTGSGTVRKAGFPTKAVAALPGAAETIEALNGWAEAADLLLASARAAERAVDLALFADSLLERYARAKAAQGLLDFDDLIHRSRELLTRPDLAAWALWKLDRGIDHLLVDEAQDTNPEQWEVIAALTAEFHAGDSAGAAGRTVFVVGDEKQSIYSFQGADPRAFGTMRETFRQRLEGIGAELVRPDLLTSFRSAAGILRLVDEVFREPQGLTLDDAPPVHEASRREDPGQVDLWPLLPKPDRVEHEDWEKPVDRPPRAHPKVQLAQILAREIAAMTSGRMLPPRKGRDPRPIRPGDIMVLVRRRDLLARALIRALKSEGVPVAGADRMLLADELAVKDLLAALRFATTPGDELSLAALLRSPLCALTEADLFDLAHARPGSLRNAAMAAGDRHPRMVALLEMLEARGGFDPVHELLERILRDHDGRRRLIARLGTEAEDPIDELLTQALGWEGSETPTIHGFIAFVETGEITVKRETERGSDAVRVMTVHSAKGLESPVVILPDTLPTRGPNTVRLFRTAGGAVLWPQAKTLDDAVTAAARTTAEAAEAAERNRLLYVALTRAEDVLVICGAGEDPGDGDEDGAGRDPGWYGRIRSAMERLSPAERPAPAGLEGAVLRLGPDPATGPAPERHADRRPENPGWLTPARAEARPQRLSPSKLVPHAAHGGTGAGQALALAWGTAVHGLLEHLPTLPPETWAEAAAPLLAPLPEPLRAKALAEAAAAMALPEAAVWFGPDAMAEPAIALDPPGGGLRMLGRIDRLAVTAEAVHLLDIKTDALVPATPEQAPAGYLAQLGAYAQGLGRIWPDRPVVAAILWTRGPRLMALPPGAMAAALARHSAPTLAKPGADT